MCVRRPRVYIKVTGIVREGCLLFSLGACITIFSVGWRASMQIRQKRQKVQKVFKKEKERLQQSLNRGKAVRRQVPFSARFGWVSWDAERSFDCLKYNFT